MLSAGVQSRLIKRDHKVGQPQTFEVRGPVAHQQRIAAIGKAHKQGAVVPLRLQHLYQKQEDVRWRSEAPAPAYSTAPSQSKPWSEYARGQHCGYLYNHWAFM